MSENQTYAACLTPAGTAAIATVALVGPDAQSIIEPYFKARGHPPFIGKFGDGAGDDVVVTFPAKDQVEIHCHGGGAVVRWIMDLLCRRGVLEISWEAWHRRTLSDWIQAEAAIALAHAQTTRTANILLDQYHGALRQELENIIASLGAPPLRSGLVVAALDKLLDRITLGLHLIHPWRVVLAGAPNVGKSTLLNKLLGFQRAITAPTPGTTRDVVTERTAFDGWPVEVADTAGVRPEAIGLEKEGMDRGRTALESADLCVWIIDNSATLKFPDFEMDVPILPVINKIDLPSAWASGYTPWPAEDILRVSAQTGEGHSALMGRMARRLVPNPPPPGEAVPFTPVIADSIRRARNAVFNGDTGAAIEILRLLISPNPDYS